MKTVSNEESEENHSNRLPPDYNTINNENDLADSNDFLTSTQVVISKSLFKSTYIVEPMAFIQNLASSIMSFSLVQFIYGKILTRLINEANENQNNTNISYVFTGYNSIVDFNFSNLLPPTYCPDVTPANYTVKPLLHHSLPLLTKISNLPIEPILNTVFKVGMNITPDDMDRIRTQAQEETSNLIFQCALFSGIPVILMTNFLGVNCTNLGRKALMIIYLLAMTLKFTLHLFQCLNPEWPDYLFYIGAFIDGVSGSSGVFYLSLYCYISDLTSPSSRSYRITLINSLNSMASLCVTLGCGYVIKYFGYFYLFVASDALIVISLLYTIFLIPESLLSLKDKSLTQRLKSCSIKNTSNCLKVFFPDNPKERVGDEANERTGLLNNDPSPEIKAPKKQTYILLLIIFANFVYNFGSAGISSVFTLFLMNKPFCFDSIAISNYTVFSTVVSLVMSLVVSKFIKINDLLICIFSTLSYMLGLLCYTYGSATADIYLGRRHIRLRFYQNF